jgi:hypothetical protein
MEDEFFKTARHIVYVAGVCLVFGIFSVADPFGVKPQRQDHPFVVLDLAEKNIREAIGETRSWNQGDPEIRMILHKKLADIADTRRLIAYLLAKNSARPSVSND